MPVPTTTTTTRRPGVNLDESHLTRPLFGQILRRIERLTVHPT
jgi:hypothetical protein